MTNKEYRENKRKQLFERLVREAQGCVDFANELSVNAYKEYVSELRDELLGKEVMA